MFLDSIWNVDSVFLSFLNTSEYSFLSCFDWLKLFCKFEKEATGSVRARSTDIEMENPGKKETNGWTLEKYCHWLHAHWQMRGKSQIENCTGVQHWNTNRTCASLALTTRSISWQETQFSWSNFEICNCTMYYLTQCNRLLRPSVLTE